MRVGALESQFAMASKPIGARIDFAQRDSGGFNGTRK